MLLSHSRTVDILLQPASPRKLYATQIRASPEPQRWSKPPLASICRVGREQLDTQGGGSYYVKCQEAQLG